MKSITEQIKYWTERNTTDGLAIALAVSSLADSMRKNVEEELWCSVYKLSLEAVGTTPKDAFTDANNAVEHLKMARTHVLKEGGDDDS